MSKKILIVFLQRIVDEIFVLFQSTEHYSKFSDCFNTCHSNMSFSSEQEKKTEKWSFPDVEVSQERGKVVITVYGKPTFCGV